MSKPCTLLQVSEFEKQCVFEQYGISEAQFEENVNHLWEWINKTALPIEENCRNKLIVFLCNGKMSLERAKRSIEGYYRIRTVHSQFFDQMLPTSDEYNKSKHLVKLALMPTLTPDLCRIMIAKTADPYLEATDGLSYFLKAFMMVEIRIMSSDYFQSTILVFDVQDIQFKHLLKYTPSVTQKLANFLVAMNLRIKNIHFVNVPSFMDHIMVLLKSVLPVKFLNKVCLHKNAESLYEYIPKEYLPSDYNGHQPSIDQIDEEWCQEIAQREEYFQKLLHVKASDYMKMANDETEIFGLGLDGSFKKILVD